MTGHIYRRGKHTWAIVVDLGPNPTTGKRRQKWHTVHGTKRDAETERRKLLNALETGSYVEPGKLTVGEYLKSGLPNMRRRAWRRPRTSAISASCDCTW